MRADPLGIYLAAVEGARQALEDADVGLELELRFAILSSGATYAGAIAEAELEALDPRRRADLAVALLARAAELAPELASTPGAQIASLGRIDAGDAVRVTLPASTNPEQARGVAGTLRTLLGPHVRIIVGPDNVGLEVER